MFFWNSLAFSRIQQMLAIWSLVPLPFLKPAWTSGISWFTYYWSLAWRILSITLLVCEMSAIVWWFEHSLALPFFGIGMKTDLFWSCGHCWVFQICWHAECSTFTASSFRIWNSSTGIPSPLLSLLICLLNLFKCIGSPSFLFPFPWNFCWGMHVIYWMIFHSLDCGDCIHVTPFNMFLGPFLFPVNWFLDLQTWSD